MAGAMADFARMPTSRKVLVFAVIGIIGGLLYWRFSFQKLDARVKRTEAEHDALVNQNQQLEGDIPKYALLRQQMIELQKTVEENQKALPTEAEIPHFFETLERKMTESGVEITRWTKKGEEQIESFVKVPVDIELVGSFVQLKRFFASLVEVKQPTVDEQGVEERERIISIENLQLLAPVVRNREIVVTAKFTAVTFRQDDSAAKAQAPAPTSSAGQGSAQKPLPPANTPAGAKARVEDSMNKAEQRSKGQLDDNKDGSAKLKEGM
jgi:Tfp pilus assembly protein PilO